MMIVLEGGSLFQANMNMIIDGHTGIEHTIPVAKAYSDVIDLWSASGTGVTPTLIVGYGGVSGEYYWYQHTNVWENERLLTFVPRTIVDPRARRRQMLPEAEYNHIDLARICKQLVDAGGHVQLGGHGQMAGLDCHWELWMFAQGGMTPLQCIRAATFDAARYIGLDGDIGSLEEGKLADLIVLDESPLENIRNSQTVRYTVINGRIYDARTMDQIGNHPQKRKKFYWEIDYRLEK
jgi:imidazolonepropionase-like amidohydrolase